MKFFFILILIFFKINFLLAENSALFFIELALKNNPKYNSEKASLKATKQNKNISRSEFFPNVTISGSLNSSQSNNRIDQSGSPLPDTNSDTETKTFEIEQKIFQGFHGYNSLKKSDIEISQANFKLKSMEQNTILDSVSAYTDLLFKIDNKNFNLDNLNLFERQVETAAARLQKGEVTLTDLAQAESSLAQARANLILAETELLTAISNFERIIGIKPPDNITNILFDINLPNSLDEALKISSKNNPELIISRLDYEISKKDLIIEKSKLSPSATINYSKSRSEDLTTTVDKIDKENVKATIKWPIISGGKNYSSIKKSKYKKEQTRLLLKDIKNKVKTETSNAWSIYKSSKSILNATKAQLEASEIANEGITLEYDSGNTRTTLEVIQSRTLLLDAKIAYAKAQRNFIISKFKLLAQVGNLSLNSIKKS